MTMARPRLAARVSRFLFLLLAFGLTGAAGNAPAADAPATGVSLDLGQGITLDLVPVAPGAFDQGSPDSEAGRGTDETPRRVTLTRGFWLGRHPVTRAQFERFVTESRYRTEAESGPSGGFGWDGTGLRQNKAYSWRNPGFAQSPDHPVTTVTFGDATAFCRWLKSKTGREFSLPTEAQWEYACRAGTTSAWHNGDSPAGAGDIAWFKSNAGNQTHPVTSARPNAWGLVMGGNVAEWCLDWYGPYLPGPVTDPVQQNPNLSDRPRRVLRGGSWHRDMANTRSAARFRNDPGSRNADNGFRVLTFDTGPIPAPAATRTPPANVASATTSAAPVPSGPPLPTSATTSPPSLPSVPQGQPPTPATTAPASRPPGTVPSHPPFQSRPRRTSILPWLLGGLVAIGIPALAVVTFLVSRLKRGASNSLRSGFATGSSSLRRTPLAAPNPTDDGFWFTSDSSRVGESFLYSYWLHDQLMQGRVVYQPDAEGRQFVFTGSRPTRITLQEAADETDSHLSILTPQRRSETSSDPTDASTPTSFPPAY